MLLHLRMLRENHTYPDTLHDPYRLGNALSRWKRRKNIHAIICNPHSVYLETIIQRYLFKYTPFPYPSRKHPFTIFWSPCKMIFRVKYPMGRSCHRDLCTTSSLSLRGGLRPTKQSHKALIIEEIATVHMRIAMTGSELCKGLSYAIHGTFIPAFVRKTFHSSPQDGVFNFYNFVNVFVAFF